MNSHEQSLDSKTTEMQFLLKIDSKAMFKKD